MKQKWGTKDEFSWLESKWFSDFANYFVFINLNSEYDFTTELVF